MGKNSTLCVSTVYGSVIPSRKRQRVLDAIRECPTHGSCVPHALKWIEQIQPRVTEFEKALRWAFQYGDFSVSEDNPMYARALDSARAITRPALGGA